MRRYTTTRKDGAAMFSKRFSIGVALLIALAITLSIHGDVAVASGGGHGGGGSGGGGGGGGGHGGGGSGGHSGYSGGFNSGHFSPGSAMSHGGAVTVPADSHPTAPAPDTTPDPAGTPTVTTTGITTTAITTTIRTFGDSDGRTGISISVSTIHSTPMFTRTTRVHTTATTATCISMGRPRKPWPWLSTKQLPTQPCR
jgi:hypothetical protein